MEFKIGHITNEKLTQEIISDVNGLSYYSHFLTNKKSQQVLDVLDSLNYQIVSGRPTKYFGLDYTHRKKTHDSKISEIPLFFNLLDPIGVNFDQIVIEYYRKDDAHSYINESDLFNDSVIIIPIGSSFKYNFNDGNKLISFLVESGSLLLISGESRNWKRSIKSRLKEKFNNFIINREDFYLLTFRKLK